MGNEQANLGGPSGGQQAPGQQAPAQAQQPGAAGAETPAYITRQEAETLAQQAAEAVWRKAQGYADKSSSRLEQRVKELQGLLGPLTNEQRAQLEKTLTQPDGSQQAAGATPDAAGPAGGGQQATAEQVNAEAERIYREAGVALEENDPEAKLVDQSSPDRFLATLREATATKAKRVNGSPARMPFLGAGGKAGGTLQGIQDSDRLWKEASEKHRFTGGK